jgi:hypothetical protein
VAVVVVPGALPFIKEAVTRYADEATAAAVEYITVDLGTPVSRQAGLLPGSACVSPSWINFLHRAANVLPVAQVCGDVAATLLMLWLG